MVLADRRRERAPALGEGGHLQRGGVQLGGRRAERRRAHVEAHHEHRSVPAISPPGDDEVGVQPGELRRRDPPAVRRPSRRSRGSGRSRRAACRWARSRCRSAPRSPVAVVSEVSSISGMWPWWTVVAPSSASRRNAMNSSAPVTRPPPASVVSITSVVGEHLAHPVPVLGVHGPEVAGLQLPDRLDVVHRADRRARRKPARACGSPHRGRPGRWHGGGRSPRSTATGRASVADGPARASPTGTASSASPTPRSSTASGHWRSRRRGRTCGSARTRSATSRPPASTPKAGASTATTSSGKRIGPQEKFERIVRFAGELPALRAQVDKDLRRTACPGAGAGLCGPPARGRLLPDRRGRLRRRERLLRPGDHPAPARQGQGRGPGSTTTRRAASTSVRRSPTGRCGPWSRPAPPAAPADTELLAYKDGGRWIDVPPRTSTSTSPSTSGPAGGQGLPHLGGDRPRRRGARRRRAADERAGPQEAGQGGHSRRGRPPRQHPGRRPLRLHRPSGGRALRGGTHRSPAPSTPPRSRTSSGPSAASSAAGSATERSAPLVDLAPMPPSNDVWDVLSTARTIRRFTDEPVDDATLTRCLEAASWAPNGANAQAWRFVVLRSPEQRGGRGRGGPQGARRDRAGVRHEPARRRRRQPLRPQQPRHLRAARPRRGAHLGAVLHLQVRDGVRDPPRRLDLPGDAELPAGGTGPGPRHVHHELGVLRRRAGPPRRRRHPRRVAPGRPRRRSAGRAATTARSDAARSATSSTSTTGTTPPSRSAGERTPGTDFDVLRFRGKLPEDG